MLKRIFICITIFFQSFCSYALVETSSDIDESFFPLSEENVIILNNGGYVSGFSEKYGIPLWVAYITEFPFKFESSRKGKFVKDSRINNSPTPKDYIGSGYDKGHMAPSYAVGRNYGKYIQQNTFYLTNIVPQSVALNRGIWKKAEQYIANKLAVKYGKVLVIVGPIFNKENTVLEGKYKSRNIFIPTATFMVLMIEEDSNIHLMAFIMPQNPDSKDIWEYATTVRTVENQTSLNFFHTFEPLFQNTLETESNIDLFKNN